MILVTGGTGFFGAELVKRLAVEGRRVCVLSRAPQQAALPGSVSWVRGDLAEPGSLRPALCNVDTVVHAGAALGDHTLTRAVLERVNVGGTEAMARAAREAGVRRFIHISSAGVYGDGCTAMPHKESDPPCPLTPYEKSKLAAEKALVAALRDSGVRWTILRPSGLYSANRPATVDFFRMVARKALWLHGPARVIVHPTHVEDLTNAVCRALELDGLDGEILNVAGARALDLRELISLIGARVGHVPAQFAAPHWTRLPAALLARGWSVVGSPPDFVIRSSRAWINRAVDTDKGRRVLGFEPVPLERGLDQAAMEIKRARVP